MLFDNKICDVMWSDDDDDDDDDEAVDEKDNLGIKGMYVTNDINIPMPHNDYQQYPNKKFVNR